MQLVVLLARIGEVVACGVGRRRGQTQVADVRVAHNDAADQVVVVLVGKQPAYVAAAICGLKFALQNSFFLEHGFGGFDQVAALPRDGEVADRATDVAGDELELYRRSRCEPLDAEWL